MYQNFEVEKPAFMLLIAICHKETLDIMLKLTEINKTHLTLSFIRERDIERSFIFPRLIHQLF